jgi:hypothetical protein
MEQAQLAGCLVDLDMNLVVLFLQLYLDCVLIVKPSSAANGEDALYVVSCATCYLHGAKC